MTDRSDYPGGASGEFAQGEDRPIDDGVDRRRRALVATALTVVVGGGGAAAVLLSRRSDGRTGIEPSGEVAQPVEVDANWESGATVSGSAWEVGGVVPGDQAADDQPIENWPTGALLTAKAEDFAEGEGVAVVFDNGTENNPSPEPGVLWPGDAFQPDPNDPDRVIAAMHQGSSDTAYAMGRVSDGPDGIPVVTLVPTTVTSDTVSNIAAQGTFFY